MGGQKRNRTKFKKKKTTHRGNKVNEWRKNRKPLIKSQKHQRAAY